MAARVPDFLTRQTATQMGEHVVNTVYTLGMAGGVALLVRLATLPAGVLVLILCVVWSHARGKAAALPRRKFQCGISKRVTTLHTVAWLVGWIAGPCMVVLGGSTPARISGLAILAGGLAADWTGHHCRFSSRCTRQRSWAHTEPLP